MKPIILSFFISICFFDKINAQENKNIIIDNFFRTHTLSDFSLEMEVPINFIIQNKFVKVKRSNTSKFRRKKEFYALIPYKNHYRKMLNIYLDILPYHIKELDEIDTFWQGYKRCDTISFHKEPMKIFEVDNKIVVIKEVEPKYDRKYFFMISVELSNNCKIFDKRDFIKYWSEAKIITLEDTFE